jgi:hypothetical protein
MGLLTWVVIVAVVLAIIGLGWQTFFGGMFEGAERIGENPVIQNMTNGAEGFVDRVS